MRNSRKQASHLAEEQRALILSHGAADSITPAKTTRSQRRSDKATEASAKRAHAKAKHAKTEGRRGRPLRAVFGLLSALLGSAGLIAALTPDEKRYSLPPVTDMTKLGLCAYGAVMFLLAVWAVGTSGPRKPKAARVQAPSAAEQLLVEPAPAAPAIRLQLPEVITPLRAHGWFVGENVMLPNAEVDYIAVGPAGVLCIQTMVTNVPDPRGRAGIRARIAAQQLERLLANQEVHVEVVPAVVAFGPGQDQIPGGVKIIDNVAILFGDHVTEWFPALVEREHISPQVQEAAAGVVAELLENAGVLVRTPVSV